MSSCGAYVRYQLVVKTFRIVNQISGMNVEESCQQQARLVGEVRPRAIFNLREIALADLHFEVASDCFYDFLLRHLTTKAAQIAFHQAEVA